MAVWIDRLGGYEVRAGHSPGLAIGVVEDGRIVYARGFGFANVARRMRFGAQTETYTAALSMQFTAAAVLLLAQNGKLKLGDEITKYVPELTLAKNVTVGELLAQTSGLPDVTKAPGVPHDLTRPLKLAALLAAMNRMKVSAPAGSQYADNPLNYMLAGLVVERAGGIPLSDYLQQNIFIPLVMTHTFLAGDSGIAPTHAVGYTYWPKGNRFVPAKPWDRSWLFGGRGVVSDVYDLAKWDIEMPILLRVDAVRTMFTPSGVAGPTRYGTGWVIDRRDGQSLVWYDGEIAGYRAMNAMLPNDHVAVVVLSNADSLHGGRTAVPETIAERILDVLVPPTQAHLDNAVIARAKEWLRRLADGRIDRTQLTPEFSAYLTDALVAHEHFAALGRLQTIVPLSSSADGRGGIVYEFLVRFARGSQYHYQFGITAENKIDEIRLVD
jgi:D-alanyl-D-alanine carboxypeptidase